MQLQKSISWASGIMLIWIQALSVTVLFSIFFSNIGQISKRWQDPCFKIQDQDFNSHEYSAFKSQDFETWPKIDQSQANLGDHSIPLIIILYMNGQQELFLLLHVAIFRTDCTVCLEVYIVRVIQQTYPGCKTIIFFLGDS